MCSFKIWCLKIVWTGACLPWCRISSSFQNSLKKIKSNHILLSHKCLGEWNSYERAPDSAKKKKTIYIWTDSAKKTALEHLQCSRQCKKTTTTIYIWTDSAKKQQTIYIWTDSAKKTALEHLQCSRLGVDRLSAPISSILPIIDIGHFKNRFADNFFFFFFNANKHTIYRWHYLLVNK